MTEADTGRPPTVYWVYGYGAQRALALHLLLGGLAPEASVWAHPDQYDDWDTYTTEEVVIFETCGMLDDITAIARWASSAHLAVRVRGRHNETRIISPKLIFVLAKAPISSNPVWKLALGHLVHSETSDLVHVGGRTGYWAWVRRSYPPTTRATGYSEDEERAKRTKTVYKVTKCVNCERTLLPDEETFCTECVIATHRVVRAEAV